jgi:hypothetical protein
VPNAALTPLSCPKILSVANEKSVIMIPPDTLLVTLRLLHETSPSIVIENPFVKTSSVRVGVAALPAIPPEVVAQIGSFQFPDARANL